MMTTAVKSFLCIALLCGLFGLNAHGAAKKLPPATRGKVIDVNAAAKTITLEAAPSAPPQKCVLNDLSTVEIDNQSVTIQKIKPGLWIRSMRLDSSTPPVVEDLDLTTKRQ